MKRKRVRLREEEKRRVSEKEQNPKKKGIKTNL